VDRGGVASTVMGSGPVVIGFDGTSVSERAVVEAAGLLAPRRALVVVVWEAGRAFDLAEVPSRVLDAPAASFDLRSAAEMDQAMYADAQRTAQWGAMLANESGLQAQGLAVADEVSVADTLVRLAVERDCEAVVVGAHRHGRLTQLLLGSTSQEVLRRAPCPVVVVRDTAQR
jgi:nucleotide-binding universal stress UspA family protein